MNPYAQSFLAGFREAMRTAAYVGIPAVIALAVACIVLAIAGSLP